MSTSEETPMNRMGMSCDNSTVRAMAAFEPNADLKEWTFNPKPMNDDMVDLRITWSGVCHSDIHTIDGDWGACTYPCVPGHEIIGIVTEVGANVTDIKVGDRCGVGPMVNACQKDTCDFCSQGLDNLCQNGVFTYNDVDDDMYETYGGYAEGWRGNQKWCFKIPDALESRTAAPLLCAGVTTYAPLKEYGVKEGDKVGILGIGGLGHCGVQYAAAMKCNTIAISGSDSKKELALELGANDFLSYKDSEAMAAAKSSFDFILCTVSAPLDYDVYFQLLKPNGRFCLVGLPSEDVKFNVRSLVTKRIQFCGSLIGSVERMKDCLEFSAEHGIKCMVEEHELDDVNAAIKKVKENSVRFRCVLHVSDE
eukprot:TRINITY_DN1559_c0_g1_i2.p1 TRINITY_DN1559_c0_g1~~TRINITY_DN1559_c0_g1_i2.p1  ORF type:complete len:365 (+),score=112.92 TRINITY_DN1559_c0_g1_i2:55-1149(+)